MVKNSLARRAAEGTPLAAAFEGVSGTLAIVWGAEDIVSLAKEITRFTELKEFEGFQARGGAMDGTKLSSAEVKQVSKWPSRQEQLSLLLGQILSPAAVLAGQLIGMGGALASQIKQRVEELEKAAPPLPRSGSQPQQPQPRANRRRRHPREMLPRRVDRRNCIAFSVINPFPPSNIIRPKRIDFAPRPTVGPWRTQ